LSPERRYWIRLLSFCLGSGFLIFYLTLNLALKGGKVTVPDLKGLSKGSAERALSSSGLSLSVKEERFASGLAPGSVLEQDIEAGATVKRGRKVSVILSKGAKIVAVPELVGLASARQARLLLEQNGLSEGVEDYVNSDAPKDSVLAQAPEGGVESGRGGTVSLLVSLGKAKQSWVMPDLRRGDAQAARGVVRSMGLVLRSVTEKNSPQSSPGAVLSQTLPPGSRVEEGAELSLVVATGAASQENARLVRIEVPPIAGPGGQRRVRITVTDASGQRPVYSAMTRPGETVSLEVRVSGKASYVVNVGGIDSEEKELP
jgi:serine/threonine-protein kinase